MKKKLLILTALLLGAFLLFTKSTQADWPNRNLNIDLNRNIYDPTLLTSAPAPFTINAPFTTQEIITGGEMLFYSDGQSSSTVVAFSLSGHQTIWAKQFSSQILRLVYDDEKLYFGADKFYSLDARNGSVIWSADPGKTNTNIPYMGRVYQVSNNLVYGFRYDGNYNLLTVIGANSGSFIYKSTIGISRNVNDLAIHSGKIYAVSSNSGSSGSTIQSWDMAGNNYSKSSQTCRDGGAAMIIDKEYSTIYITGTRAAICSYNADTLAPIVVNKMENLYRLVRYNNSYYSAWGKEFKTIAAGSTDGDTTSEEVIPSPDIFSSDPMVVNGTFYAGTSDGNIWSKNLENGAIKNINIAGDYEIRSIIYSDGYLIAEAISSSNNDSKIIGVDINTLAAAPTYSVSITSPYNTEGMNQYLGQLHSHVEIERQLDWTETFKVAPTSFEVETRYKNAGYDFEALTEHNLLIPDPGVNGILHINNSEEITQGSGGDHILAVGIQNYISPDGTDQERIDAVNSQGGIPILAHPNSSGYPLSLSALLGLESYNLIEVLNTSLQRLSAARIWGSGIAMDKWDELLSRKKLIFGTADDDYTPYDAGFDGGSVVAFSQSSSQSDILSNLKLGNFYAVQGSTAPRLNMFINQDTSQYKVSSNQDSNITFIGKNGQELQKERNVSESAYTIKGDETYVRAEVESTVTGKKSWTQPVFVNSTVNYSNLSIGSHNINTQDASIIINTSGDTIIKSLPVNQLPGTMPPAGHLSSVYSLSTTGEVKQGTSITYSLDDIQLPVNEKQLSVYTYNQNENKWEPVVSTVDLTARTITAELSHFSLYTLSANVQEDTSSPSVNLNEPTELSNLNGMVNISANASDDQAVTDVRFIVDNKEIHSDITAFDGWTADLDTNLLTTGTHKLILETEDFAGNIGSTEYDINISGGIQEPAIVITLPSASDFLKDFSNISGSYSSNLAVNKIAIYVDDMYVDKAEIDSQNNTFSKTIDWEQFVDGPHILKVELMDLAGNVAENEIDINTGQKVTATIISPANGNEYLRCQIIPLEVSIYPSGSGVEIFLDGVQSEKDLTMDLINYSLGPHIIEVKFQDQTIASSAFKIVTNYADTINMIKRLEIDGHFSNNGIPTAIIAKLRAAQIANLLRHSKIEAQLLKDIIKFVEQQSFGNRPKIDQTASNLIFDNFSFLRTPSE